ncbi:outer membrane lipoprotein carrier protein LolA [Candidatus Pelagibacter sp.]|nr:outer membrane lipoprotein carrier protein LolA [Candidatus Pelagibacter sp.]
MHRLLLIFLFTFLVFKANADNKEKIIANLNNISNFSFKFEQNINGKIENGNCIIEYPKKIYCVYDKNNKILVSNGKSLVIKTISSYYRYPLKKTPLNLILDKNFLINKIYSLEENIVNNSFINYTIVENETRIDIFFDNISLELIGWQTKDIYQNTTLTLLSSISKNQNIKKKLFRLPVQN